MLVSIAQRDRLGTLLSVTVLELVMIFGQGTRHFHFAVGTDHYGPVILLFDVFVFF